MTGVFGGSFNPVHTGHITLAKSLLDLCGLDEVWLSLSPANPLKPTPAGATDAQRAEMLAMACAEHPQLRPITDELTLPRPSYTINLLRHLAQRHPDRQFRLIIGADNWLSFPRWYAPQEIINEFGIIIYPRPGVEIDPSTLPAGVTYVPSAPLTPISSTQIRQNTAHYGEYLNHHVSQYIVTHHLYDNTTPLN